MFRRRCEGNYQLRARFKIGIIFGVFLHLGVQVVWKCGRDGVENVCGDVDKSMRRRMRERDITTEINLV